ncbi:MAG: hypothetical protein K5892_04815 [Acholeplasmatales bacterium]|nr:hypothetical protein [Acholeplasmatales bacterium]
MNLLRFDNTVASINIIKRKVARLLFVLGLLTSITFIIFYLAIILIKKEIVPTIIYSSFIFITLASSIIDILFFSNNKKVINILQKRKSRKKKRIKTNTIFIIKTMIKLVSIGYGIYLLVGNFNTVDVILVTVPSVLLLLQLLLVFLASVFIGYTEYMIIGVEEDLSESKVINFVGSKSLKANLIADQLLYSDSQEKILHEIGIQKLKDKENRHENYKLTHRMVIYNECKEKVIKLTTVKYPTNPKNIVFRKIKGLLKKFNNLYNSKLNKEEIFKPLKDIYNKLANETKEIIKNNEKYISLLALTMYFINGTDSLGKDYDLDKIIIDLALKESE